MRNIRTRNARLIAVVSATAVVGAAVVGTATPAFATVLPTITKLSVPAAEATATAVTILVTGKGFSVSAPTVTVAGAASTVAVINDTQLVATVASGAVPTVDTVGRVSVTTSAGANADTAADDFSFLLKYDGTIAAAKLNPFGKSVFPVVLTAGTAGANLTAFKANKVTATVGGAVATVAWVDNTHVSLTAPAGTPSNTAPAVILYRNGVTGATITGSAKYAAVITKLSVTSGPLAGGGTVTVTGKGFTGATAWKFGLTSTAAAGSPATPAANAATCTITNDTSASCTIPAAPKDGGLVSAGAAAAIAGSVSVSFTPAASAAYAATAASTYLYTDIV
jgi:hypothetical protein